MTVKKEITRDILINYAAILVGVITNFFFLPKYLTPDEIGIYRFIIDTPLLIIPFINMGTSYSILKYYSRFTVNGKIKGLLFPAFLTVIITYSIFIALFLFFQENITSYYVNKNPDTGQYITYSIPIVLSLAVFAILTLYSISIKKTDIASLFNNLVIKISTSALIIIYAILTFPFDYFIYGIISIYLLSPALLALYLLKKGELDIRPRLNIFKGGFLREYVTYSLFTSLSSLSFRVTSSVDILMVSTLLNMNNGGYYAIAAMIANLIEIPFNSVEKTTNNLISKFWEQNKLQDIQTAYKSVSVDVGITACFLYLGIITNLDEIFQLMPNGSNYQSCKNIVILLGLSKVLNSIFSVNSGIISFSKYYRFNIIAIIILAVITVLLNYLLIPILGVEGAVLGTITSLISFNLIKYIFIRIKFKLYLFSNKHIKIILLFSSTWVLCQLFPTTYHPIFAIIAKGAIVISMTLAGILYWNLSYNLKRQILAWITKIG